MLSRRLLASPLAHGLRSSPRALVHTEARIASLGHTLPELPQPAGAYTLGAESGGWVYLAGHLPFKENMKDVHIGRVGVEFTQEQGTDLAKITGLDWQLCQQALDASNNDAQRYVSPLLLPYTSPPSY